LWSRAALPATTPVVARPAVFVGVVVNDSTQAPIPGAEISLPELARSTLADAKGVFRLEGIQPGDHHVRIRAIGYGAADTRLTFNENETVERRVVLGRAVMLQSVNVAAIPTVLPAFDEHRAIGLGHFLTRTDLAKREDMSLVSFLEQLPSIRIVRGVGSRAWVMSARAPGSVRPIPPDVADSVQGAPLSSCYSQVYLNDVPVFSGRIIMDRARTGAPSPRWEPLFDVSRFLAAQVEAVEYYASAAETPLRYQRNDPQCGVLVIWTRRSP
jgi:hypothetical protein